MFKRCRYVIGLLIIMLLLCACDKKGKVEINSKFKQIDKDEIVVCLDDFDLFFPTLGGITERRLKFSIIAGEDVRKEDIKVDIDNVEFEYNINKGDIDEVEYYTYLSYTDVDWDEFTNLYKTDLFKFNNYEKSFVDEYENLDKKSLPKYKHFVVSVYFDDELMRDDINEITVSYKDKEYVIKGNITFGENSLPDTDNKVFKEHGLAYDELTFVPNGENKYYIDMIELVPEKDIEILDVFTMEGNQLEVNTVTVAINGDTSIDRVLKKDSSIKVSAGDKCRLNIELVDNDGKKKITYTSNPIILIKYKLDGKEYLSNVNTITRIILDSSQLYAQYVDGKDIGIYYDTFYKAMK